MMHVVVVESPAKAKTIAKYLGDDYRVVASFGHVSDLPAKQGSVLPERDFEMVYKTRPGARRALGVIKAALKDADSLILATDPDREGEAIAWQVLSWVQEQAALGDRPVHRVAFHEITPEAVREAVAHPREIDMRLVRAQQARRALDYLVGFHISPVLWRKLPRSRSAGRVQSVALRLVCEREAEIEMFTPHDYWTIEADVAGGDSTFPVQLSRLDGVELERHDVETQTMAERAAQRIRDAAFHVEAVERYRSSRPPAPPFTTSTLQQDASRRLGLGVQHIMQLAQTLYEGVELAGETTGLITYMRTDSIAFSSGAIGQARAIVRDNYGDDYLPGEPQSYRSATSGAQEAHEAIRPTDFRRLPDRVADRIGPDQAGLYDLIWRRAVASQMVPARFDRVRIDLTSAQGDVALHATGSVRTFDGFLRIYREGRDDYRDTNGNGSGEEGASILDEEDQALPELRAGEAVTVGAVRAVPRSTRAPMRYTEAGLVRRLDELGIGRPSTYASIVGVLLDREYVVLHRRRFAPRERGRLVTAFLEAFFFNWVAYGFTAGLEHDLDRIAGGGLEWKGLLRTFWAEFRPALERVKTLKRHEVRDALEDALVELMFGDGTPGCERACSTCEDGTLMLKIGRRGAFVGCSSFPDCRYTRSLAADPAAAGEDPWAPTPLGKDPDSGLALTLRRGRYGLFVQRGESTREDRARTVSIPDGMDAHDVTLEVARALLALPREVGLHPESGKPILAGVGRYGPWLNHDGTFVRIPSTEDVLTIGLNRAVVIVAEKKPRVRRKTRSKTRGKTHGKTDE